VYLCTANIDKMKMTVKYYFPVLAACFALSCSLRTGKAKDILNEAENIIEQQPDSAFRLLNTIFFPENLSKKQYNRHMLLMVQAKDKSFRDITADTLISAVRDYYAKKKDNPNAALAAYYCGRVLHEQEDKGEKAIKAYLQALEWVDKTDDYNLKGLIHGNLGLLYQKHSLYSKAIEECKYAVVMFKKAHNNKNEISSMSALGDCFLLAQQTDSAFYYYGESLKLADSCQIPALQFGIRQSMGVAYREKGDYEQAKTFFAGALSFPVDSVEQARILLNIAQVYVLENRKDSIKFYLNKAEALNIQDIWLLRTSFRLKFQIEEKAENYSEALTYYKKYHEYTLKILDGKEKTKLMEIQEKYNFEKIKNEKTQLTVRHQKTVLFFTLGLLLAGIIIFFIYRRFLRNREILRKAEQEIDVLQKEVDDISSGKQAVRDLLLQHFEVIKKTILLEMTTGKKKEGQEIIKKINKIIYGQDVLDWEKLYLVINYLNDGLYDKIHKRYPELSEKEFQICCLSCEQNLRDEEISVITKKTVSMVRRIRSDLRKKLGMSLHENFLAFFSKKAL
jgi:tetratricopeptide (TPR) repeat protein